MKHRRFLAALLAAAVLCPLAALAAGEKNVDNLPTGNLEGFESSITWFGEDFAYDITDEEACWELLQRPITVLDVSEKEVVYPRVSPNGEKVVNEWMGGSINGSLAAVHVLGEDEDGWTLIEGMDYYDRIIRGYVKTSLLKTVTPNNKYGIIIDKLTQRLYMFIDGKLWSSCAVSTGLPNKDQPYNETAAGEYLIGSWVGGFDSEGMYCEMGIRFNGGDLLHMVPAIYSGGMDANGNPVGDANYDICESALGRRASHGCVRVQRQANADGYSHTWLWNNLRGQKNVKIIIWDDDGRKLTETDASTPMYYNKNGGKKYHTNARCSSVKSRYLPLSAITYGDLSSYPYTQLSPCTTCGAPERPEVVSAWNSVIDEAYAELGLTGEK